MSDFQLSLQADPKSVDAYVGRGEVLFLEGDSEKALSDFRAALHLNSDSAPAHGGLAAVLAEGNKYDEALVEIDRAIALDPALVTAHNERARLMLRMGKPTEALSGFNLVLAIDARNVDALVGAAPPGRSWEKRTRRSPTTTRRSSSIPRGWRPTAAGGWPGLPGRISSMRWPISP